VFRSLHKWMLLIFGIPFVMIGTRLLLDAAETALIHQAAASWSVGEAQLVSVEQFSGADQTLGEQTVARYQYAAAGQKHEGAYSCVGKECPQADLYAVLQRTQAENRTMAVLIDPKKPERSLLYRHFHMPLFLMKVGLGLFCFLTGCAAVIFGTYLLFGRKEASR
jgi:hypothetical protein